MVGSKIQFSAINGLDRSVLYCVISTVSTILTIDCRDGRYDECAQHHPQSSGMIWLSSSTSFCSVIFKFSVFMPFETVWNLKLLKVLRSVLKYGKVYFQMCIQFLHFFDIIHYDYPPIRRSQLNTATQSLEKTRGKFYKQFTQLSSLHEILISSLQY